MSNRTEQAPSSSSPSCLCCRLWAELRVGSFFGVQEVDGRVVDIPQSFAPTPKWHTLCLKFVLTGWSLSVLVQDLVEEVHKVYYMMYLTHWGLFAAVLYMTCSFVLSLCTPKQPTSERPGFLVRFTWGLFSTAASLQLTLILLYWTLDYEPGSTVDYFIVMKHGVVGLLVLLEGIGVNRIPVRARHIIFVFAAALLYIIWAIIHSYTGVGNPNRMDNDPETDDDAIYGVMNWNKNPGKAAVVSAISVFVVAPILFILVWSLSLYAGCCKFDGGRRHYYDGKVEEDAMSGSANV